MQVNFPCIFSVAEIHRDSTVKKTQIRTIGQRIYLSSRKTEPPVSILSKVRLRWNVENKNHHPRDATFLEDKCRCRTIGVGILNLFNSDRGAIGPFYQGKMRLNIWHKIVSLTLAKRAAGRVRGALKLKFKEIGI
jgi:hypothetical protein